MTVKIRLMKIGYKKKSYFRIVISNTHASRNGKVLENIGTYNPLSENKINLKINKTLLWLSIGAVPTKRIKNILSKIILE